MVPFTSFDIFPHSLDSSQTIAAKVCKRYNIDQSTLTSPKLSYDPKYNGIVALFDSSKMLGN